MYLFDWCFTPHAYSGTFHLYGGGQYFGGREPGSAERKPLVHPQDDVRLFPVRPERKPALAELELREYALVADSRVMALR